MGVVYAAYISGVLLGDRILQVKVKHRGQVKEFPERTEGDFCLGQNNYLEEVLTGGYGGKKGPKCSHIHEIVVPVRTPGSERPHPISDEFFSINFLESRIQKIFPTVKKSREWGLIIVD